MSSKLGTYLTKNYSINFDLPKRSKKKNYLYNITLYRDEQRVRCNSKVM